MVYHVQFPGLGLDLTVNRVALAIGGFNIYWYGVIIAAGMLLAMLYAFRNAVDYGIDSDRLVDVVAIGTVTKAAAHPMAETAADLLISELLALGLLTALNGAFALALPIWVWLGVAALCAAWPAPAFTTWLWHRLSIRASGK